VPDLAAGHKAAGQQQLKQQRYQSAHNGEKEDVMYAYCVAAMHQLLQGTG
jgi:hypothetical protein